MLAKYYIEWDIFYDKMKNLSQKNNSALDELVNIDGIGLKSVHELKLFFSNKVSLEITLELPKLIEIEKYQQKNISSPISDMILVFTGTLETMSRSEAKSGISSGSKLNRARDKGIKVITENEWLELIKK